MQIRLAYSCRSSFAFLASSALALGQVTERVSVDSNGAEGNGYSYTLSSISADGRFVAFLSHASNLVAGDTNGFGDIFVRDRQSGTTERVSVATGGAEGNGHSFSPSISSDGHFVAFQSLASNLVAGDTNGFTDIFVRDRLSGTTERVSVDSAGAEGNSTSDYPSISADGRFVAFRSEAMNLVAGDTNATVDVFVHDRQTGSTDRISVATGGAEGNGFNSLSAISADGHCVAFWSDASNLVAGDSNGVRDVFVRDCLNGTTERVSVATGGAQGSSGSYESSISTDGRFVAFESLASDLVPGDTNGSYDVFVRDRLSGTTERVSLDSSGVQGNLGSASPSISADGNLVAFRSGATNLIAGDSNGFDDIFVRDRLSGTTQRVSVRSGGAEANLDSFWPSISADGLVVAFYSAASNLIAGDTNGIWDVFVHDNGTHDCNGNGIDDALDIQSGSSSDCNGNWIPDECDMAQGPYMDCDANGLVDSCEITAIPSLDLDQNGVLDRCQQAGTPFCFGDGSGHACPCDPGQAGTPGHGCANSSGDGAILSATGATGVAGDSLQLHIANMPNPSSVLFFQGTIQQNGGQGSFNGDGLLCVNGTGGSLIRLGAHGGQPGSSDFGAGIGNDPLLSVRGALPVVGGTRYYQAWYRDNSSFCTAVSYNFSNALTIVWAP